MAGALERIGWDDKSLQTFDIWIVRLPRKLAWLSAEALSSSRTK